MTARTRRPSWPSAWPAAQQPFPGVSKQLPAPPVVAVPLALLVLAAALSHGPSLPSLPSLGPLAHPEAPLGLCAMARGHGYACAEHVVPTDDGYLITVFRLGLPNASGLRCRQPVFLQHGVLDSAFTWVVYGKGVGLAYELVDEGYDVWLGNSRGNEFGMQHVRLDPASPEFWDFSWDQMASSDLPSLLEYVCKVTGESSVPVVAHSQGTTMVFAGMQSAGRRLRDRVSALVALGPVAGLRNQRLPLPINILANWSDGVIYTLFGHAAFFRFPPGLRNVVSAVCSQVPGLCHEIFHYVIGRNSGAWDPERLPVLLQHTPASTSVQNMVHWCQLVRGDFRAHDHGAERNRRVYGSESAPLYDLRHVPEDLPTLVISGSMDNLAGPEDVELLVRQLPSKPRWILLQKYAHMDFMWARKARVDVYPHVVAFLRNSTAERIQS
eukprot:m51a1_g4404 hypothetical protein (439) ;mRNA; r:422565-424489